MCPGHVCSGPVKLSVARHVTSGLRHLHTHSMQHEDLCPNNILLAWRHGVLEVRLCDFYSEHSGIHRTPAYAAPEVVRGPAQDVTCAADVWAFACCLLFMEGAEPFAGFEHPAAILLHLGQHLCVAFREGSTVTHFSLHDCAYGPAKHLARILWADVLGCVFVPEACRLSTPDLQHRLDALLPLPQALAPKRRHARSALARLNFA
jgi:serine/threonine protein kinase